MRRLQPDAGDVVRASQQSPSVAASRLQTAVESAAAAHACADCRDQAVRAERERVPLHPGRGLPHALRADRRPPRSCRSIRRSARASTTTSPRLPVKLKLEILDAAGKVVRSYTSEASARGGPGAVADVAAADCRRRLCRPRPGMNRFVWDLRYPGGPPAAATAKAAGSAAADRWSAPGSYRARG